MWNCKTFLRFLTLNQPGVNYRLDSRSNDPSDHWRQHVETCWHKLVGHCSWICTEALRGCAFTHFQDNKIHSTQQTQLTRYVGAETDMDTGTLQAPAGKLATARCQELLGGKKPADTSPSLGKTCLTPILKTSTQSQLVTQAKRSRGHVWVGSCDKNHPSSSDPLWGSKQNSIKTFIGCVIGLVSGPQALSLHVWKSSEGKKQKYQNETYNQLDYRLLLFSCVFLTVPACNVTLLIIPDGAKFAFFAFPCWILFVQMYTSWLKSDENKEQQEAWRLHTLWSNHVSPSLWASRSTSQWVSCERKWKDVFADAVCSHQEAFLFCDSSSSLRNDSPIVSRTYCFLWNIISSPASKHFS